MDDEQLHPRSERLSQQYRALRLVYEDLRADFLARQVASGRGPRAVEDFVASLAERLAQGKGQATPRIFAVLGHLLGEKHWVVPPVGELDVRPDGMVIGDGLMVCTLGELTLAIDAMCDSAGLSNYERGYLHKLVSDRRRP